MLTYLLVKWRRSFHLEKEKIKLEQTVNERAKEIIIKKQQLEEQSEKLKEMDQMKSRFFANISHEFRTPLTLIMGPLEQILSHDHRNLDKKAKIALYNSHRLLGLIHQLLDLSKLDSGKMNLQAYRQNFIPFLKGIVFAFEPVMDQKGLELSLEVQKEKIALYLDPGKMEQVIFNLIANAVKFTPPGGKIRVLVKEKASNDKDFLPGLVEISVCDTGPGIPRDELEHIFDRFYQSGSTYDKHPNGSGIGLALAKELIELHYGQFDIHSEEGKGTEFIVRLPLGKSHFNEGEIVVPSETLPQAKNPNEITGQIFVRGDLEIDVESCDTSNEVRTGNPGSPENNTSKIEGDDLLLKPEKNIILVVEDNDELRAYIRDSLDPFYEVIEAKDGLKGMEKAQEVIPDLIISDIMMPGIDGYQLCRQLKSHIKTSHIPIILLTAKASEENIVEGLKIGADDYITKPFSTKILIARIKNLIDLRRQMQLKQKRQLTLKPSEISISSMDEEFIRELQEIIEKNISDSEFKVDQLCKKLYLSRASLYRKIIALTGETPHHFIRSYRLKRAAQLLKANYGNVTEVAQKVGFCNIAHFSQCFKQEFHQLPSNYQSSESNS